MEYRKLKELATISISNVDKKTAENEKTVRLCNFVDVYRNWAITENMIPNFMIASAKENEIEKYALHKGDVCITKDSETKDDIGMSTYIADDIDGLVLGYHCALISPDKSVLDGKYLNAFLQTDFVRKFYELNSSGSGQRYTLSLDAIGEIPIPVISLEEQKRKGELLSLIDRKIENNNKINDNLYEQLTLFCSHISASSAAERHTLSDFCSYTSQKIDSSELNQNDYVSTDNLLPEKQGITIAKNLPAVGSATLCHNADILVSNIRPYLKKIYYCQRKMGCSSDVLNIRTTKEDLAPFIYFCLRQDAFFAHMMAGSKGTKMPRGDKNQIMRYTIMMPPTDLMEQFIKLARPTMLQIKHNEDDNNNLLRIRNYLLPLLMSGQATISD